MKTIISIAGLLLFGVASVAHAIQITVPSSPNQTAGYALVSTTTGAYIATSTDPFHVGSIFATSTSATSTFLGGISVKNAVVTDITSSLIITGSGGAFAEYTGTTCTNQVVTVLSALGVATCSSINNDYWSGTDLSVANGGTGLSTFGGTNTILYTTAADTLSSETAFTYDPTANRLTTDYASTTSVSSTDGAHFATTQGNVGVGTTSPSQKLSVTGNGYFTNIVQAPFFLAWNGAKGASLQGGEIEIANSSPEFNFTESDQTAPDGQFEINVNNNKFNIDRQLNINAFTLEGSNGFVGISTSTPGAKLSVGGDILGNIIYGASFTATSTTATSTFNGGGTFSGLASSNGLTLTGGSIRSSAADLDIFAGGGNDILLNSSGGNVGIGTTSPAQLLSVAGNGYFTGGVGIGRVNTTANTLMLQSNAAASQGTDIDIISNDPEIGFTEADQTSPAGRYQIYGTGDTLRFWRNTTGDIMTLNQGNVGIGTTSPGVKLAVVGDIQSTTKILLGTATNGTTGQFATDGTNSFLDYPGTLSIRPSVAQSGGVTILSGGNVGIGTTSPTSILAVEQGADTQLGGLTLGANGDNDYRALFMNTSGVLSFTGGDAPTFNTATLTAGGVWTDAPSFSWLKSDREVLGRTELLEILQGTNIEKFKIIAEGAGGDTHIGIVLDEADPRLASHNAEGEIVGYSPMRVASVAFAGVKELWNKVFHDHETRIEKLEKENANLKARIEKLEKQ